MSDANRSCLWDLPDRCHDFNYSTTDVYTGLGQLSYTKRAQLVRFDASLWNRMNEANIVSSDHRLLEDLVLDNRSLFTRLEYLKMGFRSLCRTVRAIQRNLLETEAFLDYLDIKDGNIASTETFKATLGAFVTNIQHVQLFRRWGINHWLICPYENALRARIQEITTMRHFKDMGFSTDVLPNAVPLHVGAASDSKVYESIKNFARYCIRFPDPFHAKCLPEPLVSDIGPLRQATRKRAYFQTKKQDVCFAS